MPVGIPKSGIYKRGKRPDVTDRNKSEKQRKGEFMKKIFYILFVLFLLVGQADAYYFKVNKTGCNERKGMVEVRYDLYLDIGDYNYEVHHVTVPIFPKEGYQGKVDDEGLPIDQKDYDKWVKKLPLQIRDNPFCCHFFQFPSDVTNEELLKKGNEVLEMGYKNWQAGDLHKNRNPKIKFNNSVIKMLKSKYRVNQIIETDYPALNTTNIYKVK